MMKTIFKRSLCVIAFLILSNENHARVIILNPGCITSGNQLINQGAIPKTITATPASNGTCSGSYSYQWQKSFNDTFFVDILGATSQNLSFTDSLSQTTFFQRKTTCGSEIKYTLSVSVTISPQWLYYNSPKSDTFTRNNCGSGYVGADTIYVVDSAKYSSTISKAYVDSLARKRL
jgi:hypothetical protein